MTTRKTPGKELEVYAGPWHVRAWKPRPGETWDKWTEAVMIEIRAGNTKRIYHLLNVLRTGDEQMGISKELAAKMAALAPKPHAWLRYDVPADLMAVALGMEVNDG